MNRAGDASTRDPRQLYITLRKDLHVSVQYYRGKPCYLLEDPQEIQFYRVGIAEGTFISMLDGKTSLDDVLRQSATSLGKDAFSEQEAMQIVRWLLDVKLGPSLGLDKPGTTKRRSRSFPPPCFQSPGHSHPLGTSRSVLYGGFAVVCLVVRIGGLGSLDLRVSGRALAVNLLLEFFHKRIADRCRPAQLAFLDDCLGIVENHARSRSRLGL